MADYTEQATWSTKDALASGSALKAVSATELGTEFGAISTAVATKYDSNDLASQAAAQAGTSNAALMTPLRTEEWSATWAAENAGIVGDLQALADPGADVVLGWDDVPGAAIGFTLGGGLTSSGTSLIVDINGTTAQGGLDGASDLLLMWDASDGSHRKVTLDDAVAGAGGSVPTSRTITSGTGMTGGGDLSANRTLDVVGTAPIVAAADAMTFDISSLSELTVETIAAADTFLVDDGNGGTNKRIAFQSMGPRIQSGSTQTIVATDANCLFYNSTTSTQTYTIPADATTDFPIGSQIGFVTQNTGVIIIATGGTPTIHSLSGNLQIKASGGGAYLVKTATNVWSLVGDLEA